MLRVFPNNLGVVLFLVTLFFKTIFAATLKFQSVPTI